MLVGIFVPTEYTKQIIIWGDPHYDRQVMHHLSIFDVQKQGDFTLIQDLHVGGVIKADNGPDKNIV